MDSDLEITRKSHLSETYFYINYKQEISNGNFFTGKKFLTFVAEIELNNRTIADVENHYGKNQNHNANVSVRIKSRDRAFNKYNQKY